MPVTHWEKKPIVVEAMLYDGTNADEILSWCEGSATIGRQEELVPEYGWLATEIKIQVGQNLLWCRVGDYVVKEPFSLACPFFIPVRPSIMSDTYTRVGDKNHQNGKEEA